MRLQHALLAASPLLQLAAAGSRGSCPRGGPDLPTVVIGAGTAGLTAAMALRAHNCSCLVLEARPRIGGRLHTFADGPFEGVELGGHWVHGGLANRVTPPVLAHLGILDRLEYAGGDSTYEGPWNSIALFDPAGAPVPALARDNAYADYEVGRLASRGRASPLAPLATPRPA